MDKKLITAQEAKEKANAYYSLQRICEQISENAEDGRTLIRISSISPENKIKLEELGYDDMIETRKGQGYILL